MIRAGSADWITHTRQRTMEAAWSGSAVNGHTVAAPRRAGARHSDQADLRDAGERGRLPRTDRPALATWHQQATRISRCLAHRARAEHRSAELVSPRPGALAGVRTAIPCGVTHPGSAAADAAPARAAATRDTALCCARYAHQSRHGAARGAAASATGCIAS